MLCKLMYIVLTDIVIGVIMTYDSQEMFCLKYNEVGHFSQILKMF